MLRNFYQVNVFNKLRGIFKENMDKISNNPNRVVVIDNFSHRDGKIAFGTKVSHGEVVQRFLEENLPSVFDIERCDCYDNQGAIASDDKIKLCLKKYLDQTKNGNPPAAINLSLGNKIYYSEASKVLGEEVNAKNLAQHKEKLRELFEHSSERNWQMIELLDELTARGVDVYVAAGNKFTTTDGYNNPDTYFNPLTLANGVKVVGATDKDGNFEKFSVTNSLINASERGEFKVNQVKENGVLGCDYTEDGTMDVLINRYAGKYVKLCTNKPLQGTSLATPLRLAKDLWGKIFKNHVQFDEKSAKIIK